jgi:hypothetical protein
VLGGQTSPYLEAGQWEGSFGYRWQRSDRHFTGSHEDKNRETEHSQVINDIHLLDFGVSRGITERLSGSFSLPVVLATRSTPLRDAGGTIVGRDQQTADGIGDMSLLGRFWVLKPSTHLTGNLSIATGVKFPTGDTDVRHQVPILNRTTGLFVQQERTVDQSITPGDGGFGWIVDAMTFKTFDLTKVPAGIEAITLFAQGSYLFNPRNTNGVPTFRTLAGEEVMSVTDQYLARIGFGFPLLAKHGLSFSLAGRIEGVPVHDLIGASGGFRRPGYAVSIEPGLTYAFGSNAIGVSTPVALFRDRLRSVADRMATPERHGDAAFADFMVLFSFSHRFGAPSHEGAAAPVPPEAPVPTLPSKT